jgi:hypothetical protein
MIPDGCGETLNCGTCADVHVSSSNPIKVSVTLPDSSGTGGAWVMAAGYVLVGGPAVASVLAGRVSGEASSSAPDCAATAPAGSVAVTRCLTKPFKKNRVHITLTLRLDAVGRRLLGQQGHIDVEVVGVVTDHHGQSSRLQASVSLLRRHG